jgi:YbbR domain-containing protein
MVKMRHWLGLVTDYARDYFLENTDLKILALLITAVLWLSVAARPENRVTIPNVPVEFRNMPPGLEVSKYETLSVRVYLSGPRDVLDAIRPSDLTVVGDLAGVEPGVRLIDLKLDSARLPTGVEAETITPGNIRITVEREEVRSIPIHPRFEGQPPEGHEVYNYTVSPEAIRVRGAASHVQSITEVSTETISLSGKTEPFSEQVAVDTGPASVTIDEESRYVMLTVVIGEVRKERVIERVPVTISGGPPLARAIPQFVSVSVYGARSAVDQMTPADVAVTVAYQEEQAKGGPVTPEVTIAPEYVNKVAPRSITPQAVRVR